MPQAQLVVFAYYNALQLRHVAVLEVSVWVCDTPDVLIGSFVEVEIGNSAHVPCSLELFFDGPANENAGIGLEIRFWLLRQFLSDCCSPLIFFAGGDDPVTFYFSTGERPSKHTAVCQAGSTDTTGVVSVRGEELAGEAGGGHACHMSCPPQSVLIDVCLQVVGVEVFEQAC